MDGERDREYARELTPLELETLVSDMRGWPKIYLPKLARLLGHVRFLENRERHRQANWLKQVTPPKAKPEPATPLERAKVMVRTGSHISLRRYFEKLCQQAELFTEEVIEMVQAESRKPQP